MSEIAYLHALLRSEAAIGYGAGELPNEMRAPVAMRDDVTTDQQSVTFDPRVNDIDPEGGALTVTTVTAPSLGLAGRRADGTAVSWERPAGSTAALETAFDYTVRSGASNRTATGRVLVKALELVVTPPPPASEYPAATATVNVTTDAQLRTAINNASQATGDVTHIVLANGVYSGNALTLSKNNLVIRAANKLMAELRFTVTLGGDHLTLWGCKFTGDNGKVVLTGNHDRVLRCEFTGWRFGHAVRFGHGGSHGQVRYCHIHDPGSWTADEISGAISNPKRINIRFVGTPTTFHRFGRISHCLFKDTLQRPVPGNYHTGQADFIEVGEAGADYPSTRSDAVIEYCIFDGNTDPKASGILDVKISGTTVRYCTFKNSTTGRLDSRYGQGSVFTSNFFATSVAGVALFGANHVIGGNVFEGNSKLQIGVGNIEWNQYIGANYQRPKNILCVNNSGLLIVGTLGPGSDKATLPADGTRIEAHTGTIRTQQAYSGGWATPTNGLLETGTTYSATASQTYTRGSELAVASVGPNATWTA